MDKRGSHASLNGLPDGEPAASTSLQTSTGEREALLNRLRGSEENRGDLDELLAASAKALQDAGTRLSCHLVWVGSTALLQLPRQCVCKTVQQRTVLLACACLRCSVLASIDSCSHMSGLTIDPGLSLPCNTAC